MSERTGETAARIEVLEDEAIDENPDAQTRRETFELELMGDGRSEEGGAVDLEEEVETRRSRGIAPTNG